MVIKRYTIKEMNEDCRPRERLLRYGPDYLSEVELLAIIINSGYSYRGQSKSALDLAQDLLSRYSLGDLLNTPTAELQRIPGIGEAKATMIKAALELSRRLSQIRHGQKYQVRGPRSAAKYLIPLLRFQPQEIFAVLLLNAKNEVLRFTRVHIGTVNASLVHPREVFREAIASSSVSCIIAHNHPSGDKTPSQEDIAVTKRLVEAGKIVGIEIVDHIIVAHNEYFSFKEQGLI